jgi:hypothetical protein
MTPMQARNSNQEGTGLVSPDDGEDHARHDAHRAIAHDSAKVGRCQREVEMPEPPASAGP